MSNCGCQFNPDIPPVVQVQQSCPSTNAAPATTCRAPTYSRACLSGDPALSPLAIERASRQEHLWQRSIVFTPGAAVERSFFDILFAAFTASGTACLKSVSMFIKPTDAEGFFVPVVIVGIAGVWDFTDSTPNWTERVAHPCEYEVLDISTTSGRCPCQVDCEGCLYPRGVGGKFVIRFRIAPTTIPLNAVVTLTATGTHTATPPCCVLPMFLNEPQAVTGTLPSIQDQG